MREILLGYYGIGLAFSAWILIIILWQSSNIRYLEGLSRRYKIDILLILLGVTVYIFMFWPHLIWKMIKIFKERWD